MRDLLTIAPQAPYIVYRMNILDYYANHPVNARFYTGKSSKWQQRRNKRYWKLFDEREPLARKYAEEITQLSFEAFEKVLRRSNVHA